MQHDSPFTHFNARPLSKWHRGLTMADHRAIALLFNTTMQMRRRSRCCLACYGCQAPLHGVQVAAPALLRQTFCWDLLRS